MKYKIGDHVIIEESNIERLSKFAGRTGVIGKIQKGLENDHPYWINVDNWGDDTDGVWCNVKGLVEEVKENKAMKVTEITNGKVRCVGYNQDHEKFFKLGKVYEVKDNKVTNENGFTYKPRLENVIKYLSTWYTFEVVYDEKIVITHDGKTTKATLYRDGEKFVATARCAPEDKFDFTVGAELAMKLLIDFVNPVTVKGFKVGDRVHFKTWNGTIIAISEHDNLGVEFDNPDAPGFHDCSGVDLRAGNASATCKCRWFSHDELAHGEYVPKYYNGRMVCVDRGANQYTVGKIYEMVDGLFSDDVGEVIQGWDGAFKSFQEFAAFSSAKWIEIKE